MFDPVAAGATHSQSTWKVLWEFVNSQFVSAFFGAGFGALAAYYFSVWSDRRKSKETLAFEWLRYKSNSQLEVVSNSMQLFFTAKALLEQWKLDIENRRVELDPLEEALKLTIERRMGVDAIAAAQQLLAPVKRDFEAWSNNRREQYNRDVYGILARGYALLYGYEWCMPTVTFNELKDILGQLDSTQIPSDIPGINQRLEMFRNLQPRLLKALTHLRKDVETTYVE